MFFDELARKLLHQSLPGLSVHGIVSESHQLSRVESVDDRKELQFLASELVAAIISAKVNGYNLLEVESQIQRYLTLEARSLSEPSLLAESITGLEQAVKDLQLEQMINRTGSPNAFKTNESFFLRYGTLEHILSTWVDHYCLLESEVQSTLKQDVITARLEDVHISPDDTIADLLARYKLFGYHNFAQDRGYDHYYLLFPPGLASKDFFASLDNVQFSNLQWVRFPDEEKLIYMHIHRTRLQ